MAKKKVKEEALKGDIEGFRGGLNVDLSRVMDSGHTLEEDLSSFLQAILRQECENQRQFIDKIPEWENQYKGRREEKSWPWINCSNVAVPLTRSNIDAIYVRVIDVLFNQQKIALIKAVDPEFVDIAKDIEDAFNHWIRNTAQLKEKLKSVIKQAFKVGTGVVKIVHENKKRKVTRYATELEEIDPTITKYKLDGTDRKGVKDVVTEYEGPNIYAVDRANVVISSDATCLQDAFMFGFYEPKRKDEIDQKVRQGLYREEAAEGLTQYNQPSDVQQKRAAGHYVEIEQIDPTKTFDIWELWIYYDVDEDGESDHIVVTYHLDSGSILRAIYNPIFDDFRPFVAFKPLPEEQRFDGESYCEILAPIQREVDTLHNQRIDRLTQINMPMLFIRSGSGLENLKLKPGKVWVVNDELEGAFKEFNFSDTTYSTHMEEDRLMSYGDRAVGITQAVLGMQEANRPVARETMSNLQEAGRKFKDVFENFRDQTEETLTKFLETFAQYQPTYSYKAGEGAEMETKTVNFPIEYIRDGLKVELYASSEIINQELRREINMTLYQLMGDYYTRVMPSIQAITDPMTPVEIKKFLIGVLNAGQEIMADILRDFDKKNIDTILIDVQKWVDLDMALQQTMSKEQLMQMKMGGPPQQGGPPNGPQGPPQGPQ